MYTEYLNSIIGQANGIAANVEGQRYEVRRLTPQVSGSVLDSAPIGSIFARISHNTTRALFENQTFDSLIYQATVDYRPLVLGDVLTEVGPRSDHASYIYAQHRVTREVFWARAESVATIRRPADVATRAALLGATPTTQSTQSGPVIGFGAVDVPGVTEVDEATFDVLTLTNGVYAFAGTDTNPIAARIPVGLQPTARAGTPREEGLPTDNPGARSSLYVPPIPGETLRPGDTIVIDADDEYLAIQVHSSDTVGLVGAVAIIGSIDI